MDAKTIQFQNHGGDVCKLIALEGEETIPFPIRRVYYFCQVDPSAHRGCHAHKQLQQVFICLQGSCTLLLDNGTERQCFTLSDPCQGLYAGPGLWRELYDFAPGTVVLVLTDQHYDEADYLRSYEEYLQWLKQ